MATSWHAVEVLEESLNKTKKLLFEKANIGFWLKLGLIVFLIGGGSSFNPIGFGGGSEEKSNATSVDFAAMLPFIAIVIAIVLIIGLVFSFIRAVCQFILIECVTSGNIEIIKGFKRNMDNGFNLFLFNLAFGFIVLVIILAPIIASVYLLMKDGGSPAKMTIIMAILGFILYALLVSIPAGIIGTLTNEFVTLFMYRDKKGVMDGWRKLWIALQKNLNQFIVYFLLKIGLGIAAGIIQMIATLVLMLVAVVVLIILAIGPVIVAIIAIIALNLSQTAISMIAIPAVLVLIIYFLLITYLIVVATLPIPVFFRYYSIMFLQNMEKVVNVAINRTSNGKEPKAQKAAKKEGKKQSKGKIKVY